MAWRRSRAPSTERENPPPPVGIQPFSPTRQSSGERHVSISAGDQATASSSAPPHEYTDGGRGSSSRGGGKGDYDRGKGHGKGKATNGGGDGYYNGGSDDYAGGDGSSVEAPHDGARIVVMLGFDTI